MRGFEFLCGDGEFKLKRGSSENFNISARDEFCIFFAVGFSRRCLLLAMLTGLCFGGACLCFKRGFFVNIYLSARFLCSRDELFLKILQMNITNLFLWNQNHPNPITPNRALSPKRHRQSVSRQTRPNLPLRSCKVQEIKDAPQDKSFSRATSSSP